LAEAEVDFAGKNMNVGKLGADHIDRAVPGMVVDDEDLNAEVAPLLFYGLERLAQHLAGVERDDDQGQVEWSGR
jgi:hypothetical protein